MISHAEKRVVPYTPEQMYRLVGDIASYDQFLPWCMDVKILRASETEIIADLTAGYKFIRERFRSKVMLDPRSRTIEVDYLSGPLKHLDTVWHFVPHPDGCLIDFKVVFEFESRLIQNMAMMFFNEIVKRMVGSIEKRAADIYSVV
ncbi:MAG TPA: type II toxin-antitoxin system RatA family toxin [Alphaproteobacteria bacterium]